MTLALLLTAVTGAWAISDPNAVYWDYQTWTGWTESVTTHTVGDITITCSGNAKAYESTSSGEPLALQAGANDAITFTSNGKPFASIAIMTDDELNVAGWTYNSSTRSYEWSGEPTTSVTLSGCDINADYIIFTFGTAEAPVTVEPVTGQQNQWTFSMPGSDVVLTPIYAKAAAFATTGTEPDVKTLLPEAAEGVIADTDAPLIKEGTGIVAFAAASTEVKQGTLMYAIGSSATQAPALTDFNATVPTAQNVADDGADVHVWYYIQGADAPQGEAATLDNTFSDTEPACLTVQVLSNKFDIQLNAANANTIEAGKATVTVAGAAATVTDGKLQGVKMGSEVKLEAKPGYKFRKVEVKKTEAAVKVTAITLNKTATTITAGQTETLSVSSVTPDDATDQTVTWSSDNEAVATVDADGKVTAVALGTANITATANDGSGVTATCAVTVNKVVTINQSDWGDGYSGSFTKDGVTVSAEIIDSQDGNLMGGGTFSTTLGNFTKIVVTTLSCSASGTGWSGSRSSMTWAGTPASTVSFSGEFMGRGRTQTTIVCTIEPTN